MMPYIKKLNNWRKWQTFPGYLDVYNLLFGVQINIKLSRLNNILEVLIVSLHHIRQLKIFLRSQFLKIASSNAIAAVKDGKLNTMMSRGWSHCTIPTRRNWWRSTCTQTLKYYQRAHIFSTSILVHDVQSGWPVTSSVRSQTLFFDFFKALGNFKKVIGAKANRTWHLVFSYLRYSAMLKN